MNQKPKRLGDLLAQGLSIPTVSPQADLNAMGREMDRREYLLRSQMNKGKRRKK